MLTPPPFSSVQVHCSRYVNQHMVHHNQETHHPLSLSFADLSVWCYSCDDYIHNEVSRGRGGEGDGREGREVGGKEGRWEGRKGGGRGGREVGGRWEGRREVGEEEGRCERMGGK